MREEWGLGILHRDTGGFPDLQPGRAFILRSPPLSHFSKWSFCKESRSVWGGNTSRVEGRKRGRMRQRGGWSTGPIKVGKNVPLGRLKSLLSLKTTSPHQLGRVAPGRLFHVGLEEKRGIRGINPHSGGRRRRESAPQSPQNSHSHAFI